MEAEMSYYEFQRDDAFRFRDFIGIQTKIRGKELMFQKCPYCGNRSDDKNKFSINLETGAFNCFRASCGAKGNMITLSRDFGFSLGDDVDRYFNLNNRNNRFRTFKEFRAKHSDKAVGFCMSRGISPEVCERYGLQTKKDSDDILVFPFLNEKGELKFIKYRNMSFVKGESKGSKEWCEKDCMPILFGMNLVPEDASELIITEGQLDTLAVAEAGFQNAVSVPTGANGFTWVPHCWNWMQRFKSIIVFGDCEHGKITLADQMAARFGRKVRICRPEDYKGYKDANEILVNLGADAVRSVIGNAEEQRNKHIKQMADVEYIDMTKMPKIETGVRELDKVLGGGMFKGNLIIQTGKRGDGKSTWASNLCVNALSQDVNCMIYSGEMPNFQVRNWIDSQIMGKKSLTNSEADRCGDWYRNRLYIYDSSMVDDGEDDDRNEEDILLETFEDAVVRLNTELLVVDNLMTVVDSETNESLYRRQSKFVGKLARMCKRFEIVIVLVAHPRKSNPDNFDNDDVSGASEITNKADIVLNYARLSKKEAEKEAEPENVRWLMVTKNRTGNGVLKKIMVDFSPDSKRIVEHGKGLDCQFVAFLLRLPSPHPER